MSKLKVNLPGNEIPVTGKQISFIAPCSCADVTCLVIDGVEYSLVDACANAIAGEDDIWVAGALISVLLDVENARAFLLGAAGAGGLKLVEGETYGATLPETGEAGQIFFLQV